MNLQGSNGSLSSWNISDIANYRFEGVTAACVSAQSKGKLEVYPNPVNVEASIFFASHGNQRIRIELLDVLGRSIREIYSGYHAGEHTYIWQADVPKGLYLLRLTSENGQLTQSVIIQ
jgi:hypothetical protein